VPEVPVSSSVIGHDPEQPAPERGERPHTEGSYDAFSTQQPARQSMKVPSRCLEDDGDVKGRRRGEWGLLIRGRSALYLITL